MLSLLRSALGLLLGARLGEEGHLLDDDVFDGAVFFVCLYALYLVYCRPAVLIQQASEDGVASV